MKKITTSLTTLMLGLQLTVTQVFAVAGAPIYVKKEVIGRINAFLDEYNLLLTGVWGALLASSVLVFAIHLIKLGQYSNYPMARQKIINDLIITGICTALLGSFGLFFFMVTKMVL